jgi:ABC-type glycerol-3-phosphate transport system permease component
MRNFFRDMPAVIGESARIDGATDIQIFYRIYLPLAGPAINALLIFKLLAAWNDFNLSLFILTRQRNWTIPLAVMMIQQNEYTYYGYIFSSAVMTFIPIIVLTLIFNHSFINGISAGSVKE